MKLFAWCALAATILFGSALFAADPPREQVQASSYFEALMAGDVEKANALIAVPFSLDRKSILKTKEEVDAVHKKIAESKGTRPVPKYTIANTDEAPKLDAAVFPKYVAFRLVMENEEGIDIYVSVGDSPKVLGFSD
jgi:transcription antitermination factor NusG